MKKLILIITLIYQFQLCAQKSYRINWINKNLSYYSSYTVSEFKVNNKILDYNEYKGSLEFVEIFISRMSKMGLEAQDSSILLVLFDIKIDTLWIGFERARLPIEAGILPEDRLIDLTLTMIDSEVSEKLVIANVFTTASRPKKFNKNVKAMIREFFKDAFTEAE